MRKILLIALVFAGKYAIASQNQLVGINKSLQDTTIICQILALPLNNYIGMPVDSLLAALPSGYSNRYFIPAKWGYAKGISQGYGSQEFPNCFIQIFIDTFTHVPVPNYTATRLWDMNLARLETISFIKVVKNNRVCLYGCNNPNYY